MGPIKVVPKAKSIILSMNRVETKCVLFRHSHIAITDYELGDNPELEKAMSVFNESKWRYKLVSGYYVKRLREFRLPRSIDTNFLANLLPGYPAAVDNANAVVPDLVDYKLTAPPLNDEQRAGVSFLCSQGYFEDRRHFTYRRLNQSAGSGKTYECVAAASYMRAKVIVVIPKTSSLIDQWKRSFLEFTNMSEDDILIVRGSELCYRISRGDPKYTKAKVFIFMTDTLCSFAARYGDLALIDMADKTGAYLTIMDEAHCEMKSMCLIHALVNTRMTILATATPGRVPKKEKWIYNTIHRNMPRFGGGFKTKDELFLEAKIVPYHWQPSEKQIRSMTVRGWYNGRETRKLNVRSYETEFLTEFSNCKGEFFDKLKTMMAWSKRVVKPQYNILVLCATRNGTHVIEEFLKNNCFPDDTVSHYHKTGMGKKELEEALKAHVIVATEDSAGMGFDIKMSNPDAQGIQHVYNICTYSSWVKAGQNPGRARKLADGTQVYYIEFVNFGFNKTLRQYESRKPELEKQLKSGKVEVLP